MVGEQVAPRSDDQALSVARLLEFAVVLDAAKRALTTFAENVVPRGDMEHRHVDARGVAVDVGAIPVLAVIGMGNMIGEVWCRLLQEPDPVLDRKVAIPIVG